LAVGLVGLYLWQKRQERFGWLGTIGVILIVTASVLIALGGLAIVIVDGVLKAPEEALNEVVHPLELLVIIGAVLFGMATMQMNVLPSGGALLIIVGALGFFGISFAGVGPEWLISVAVAVLGVGWAWLGYALLLKIGRSAQQPKRVR
jgi:hypothetical protein